MFVIYYYDVVLCTVRAGNLADAAAAGWSYVWRNGVRVVEV
jgi:hypothetical protein